MRGAALRATDVSVAFGGLLALDSVTLAVEPSEVVGLIGPNGAGKTTLFDCLTGLVPATGSVELLGRDVTRLAPHQRAAAGLGRSYQDARLFPTLSVLDCLRTAAELQMRHAGRLATVPGTPSARRGERDALAGAEEIVDLLGLGGYAHKFVRELSTGTRRIVDLGCLLVQRPAVILFDEPSSGIAQREAEALGPLLLAIRERTGAALLVIEHDMPLLMGIAERVYALETGRVIAEGLPGDVVHHPEVVRSYLGDDLAAINRSGALGGRRRPLRAAGRTAKTTAKN
jgi:ABC-type branched-subunit amino acid transport system ATPase component